MKNVLIISGDTVNSNMGGLGVRNWELARALSKDCSVTLAVPNQTDLITEEFQLYPFNLEKDDLRTLAQNADTIIIQGSVLHFHPYLRELDIPLAVDLYIPSLLESLVWHDQDDWENWIPAYEEYLRVQLELLRAGDFFICASERQRDYWLGWLHAQKRINPHTYRQDPTLRKLIDVVPFGLPEGVPASSHPVLKGVHPGISPQDRLILWSGGLWDWLDPLTLIRAVAQLRPLHPDIKLYFMGTQHPNPGVSGMNMPEKAIQLSHELNLYGETIFFGNWVPYQEREAYLIEADLAVVSHPGHIETHFSFRTRVLDCIWAGLPIITTQGDAMSDLVERNGLGFTVPPEDVSSMAEAIEKILTMNGRETFARSFEELRQSLRWQKVIAPLLRFCLSPAKAPDKSRYLTETERISRDKDAFLQQIIQDKDAFLEQIIHDKDAQLQEFQNQIERYQMLPLRIYRKIKHILRNS
jgi:glycosyltransferase involved in cell wall biosynthesis